MFLLTIFIVLDSGVDNSITEDDKQAIPVYLKSIGRISTNASYEDQLRFIASVQKHVRKNVARRSRGIPLYQRREPKELLNAKSGLCFDRSRVIEKILKFSGFKTRHVYISKDLESSFLLLDFLKAFTVAKSSHATTEVLTKNGWLVVDSNNLWLSLTTDNKPVSIKQIHESIESKSGNNWKNAPPDTYLNPFVYLYGLYSRHGKFYPPYNFIPDINHNEFMQNI